MNDMGLQRAVARSLRAILVEDDRPLREGLSDYLRVSGVTVKEAENGGAFLAALQNESFDVAILDVNLPDTSGFDLVRRVNGARRMGLIMLTARSSQADRTQGYAEGADIYLTKPVGGQELLLAIRNLARRVQEGDAVRLESHLARSNETPSQTWVLKSDMRSLVTPAGVMIKLSGRELLLLEHLADLDGQAATRIEVLALLGYDKLGPLSRSLDSLLHRLRQKAENVGAHLPINVIHAIGIRFSGLLQKS